jgi:hypothetical protein
MMIHQPRKPEVSAWPAEKLGVLDSCQRIHKLAEEFYQYLAEIHQDQRDIARMWGLLSIDKCNHSDAFKMLNRIKGVGISDINIPSETAATILNKMKTIPKGDNRKPPSVTDALRFTVKMEESLNSVHISQVIKFSSDQNTVLMASTLKSNSSILTMMTEEYLNLTVLD